MIFFTAAFGETHAWACSGLVASFERFMPDARLHVFTDHEECEDGEHVTFHKVAWSPLYAPFGDFYSQGSRRNVFKLPLFREVMRLHPGETVCWLDADTLVLEDLRPFLREGVVNVVGIGESVVWRAPNGSKVQYVRPPCRCGNGLVLEPSSFVVGGCYALPDTNAVDGLEAVVRSRATWEDLGQWPESGDQVALNHYVYGLDGRVHRVDRDRSRIFALEHAAGNHPRVDEPALLLIERKGDALYFQDRRIALFYWVAACLFAHDMDNWRSFRSDVAEYLKGWYA